MQVWQFTRAMLGCMQLWAIHKSFALYDGDVIGACRANKAVNLNME